MPRCKSCENPTPDSKTYSLGTFKCVWCGTICVRKKANQVAGCYGCYEQHSRKKYQPAYRKGRAKLLQRKNPYLAHHKIVDLTCPHCASRVVFLWNLDTWATRYTCSCGIWVKRRESLSSDNVQWEYEPREIKEGGN